MSLTNEMNEDPMTYFDDDEFEYDGEEEEQGTSAAVAEKVENGGPIPPGTKISFNLDTKSEAESVEDESQSFGGSRDGGGYFGVRTSDTYEDEGTLGDEGSIIGDEDDIWRQDLTFAKLQDIYTHIIDGLELSESRGVSLEPVKALFKNVWEGIENSHDNVLNLRKKDHVLSVQLSTVMAKTQTLIKLAEDNPVVCQKLKTKLESAWGLADVGEAEERKNLIKINEYRDEIAVLTRSIDAASRAEGQDTITELKKLKHGLELEKSSVMTEASKLHSKIETIKLKREELEVTFANLKDKLAMIHEEMRMQQDSIEKETQRKGQIRAEIIKATKDIGKKIYELDTMDTSVTEAQERLANADKELYNQRLINEDAVREKEMAGSRFDKMKEDCERQIARNEKLRRDLARKEDELKEKETEFKDLRYEFDVASRQHNADIRKSALLTSNLEIVDKEREELKVKLAELENQLKVAQKKLDENRQHVEALDKERTLINRNVQKANTVTSEHIHQAKTHQVAVRNLEVELTAFEKEIIEQEATIARLERERDNYSHEATKLAHQVALRLDDIKKLNLAIFEYQRRLGEVETNLKKQQQILDATTYEISLLSRTLREIMTEIKDNFRQIHHLGHQITSLKFQLFEKDAIIRDEAENYERILKDTNFYTSEAKRIKRLEYDLQRQIDGLAVERSILGRTIAEIEGEISKQNYYAKSAESRKEVYLRKLMGKEKEVKDIWEKWRALHSTIRIGSYHFRITMDEIRTLRYYIFESKKEKLVFKSASRNVQKLRHEIAIMENLISKEICMCNSLKEQMKRPINVHRWRVLECAYPKSFELVQKSNLLTKRLVERNNLLASQAEDLVLKQQIYCQIRLALNKSPGLEAPENVRYYAHLLAAKKKQFATLKTELKESEAQTDYYKIEIRNVQEKVFDLKSRYFRRMRQYIKTGKYRAYCRMLAHRRKLEEQNQEKCEQHSAGAGSSSHDSHPLQLELAEPFKPAGEFEQAAEDIKSLIKQLALDKTDEAELSALESENAKIKSRSKKTKRSFDKYLY